LTTIAALSRLVLALAALGLVAAAGAQADHLDPQKRIVPADQARARSMLLKRADVAAVAKERPAGKQVHTTCRALDESDLVQTGHATSPEITLADLISFQSVSGVYATAAHAATAWRRGTGAAGFACGQVEFSKLATGGLEFESFRTLPFPRVAQRTKAYRATYTGVLQGQRYRLYGDAVYLLHARAIVGFFVASPIVVPRKAVELRLARLVARRMARAMG
jgi:hypothetical protein